MTFHMTAGGLGRSREQTEGRHPPHGPAGGADGISQRCSAWPLASFHASLLFQCKSEATQVIHLRYRVNMEIKPRSPAAVTGEISRGPTASVPVCHIGAAHTRSRLDEILKPPQKRDGSLSPKLEEHLKSCRVWARLPVRLPDSSKKRSHRGDMAAPLLDI